MKVAQGESPGDKPVLLGVGWGGGGVRIAEAEKYDFFSCNFISLSNTGDRAVDNSEDLVLMMLCFCMIIICRFNWLF